ncbi:MAG: type IIL restriction-modification enzyme MmeI [Halobacteriota archaeon]
MHISLSWNEIRKRATVFSNAWKDEKREKAEAQTFWNDFFKVFGRERRVDALFEKTIRKLGNKRGSIDLFWEGELVVEHKSEGESLDKAYDQALDYFEGLDDEQLPKYVIVSDFKRFRLYDLKEHKQYEIKLEELAEKIHLFEFMRGDEGRSYEEEDPVNIKAAELMGKLHDSLEENGYEGHPLEVLLVRLMFCLFADDTGIFETLTPPNHREHIITNCNMKHAFMI